VNKAVFNQKSNYSALSWSKDLYRQKSLFVPLTFNDHFYPKVTDS